MVGLTVCVKVLWGLGFRVRVYVLVLVSGLRGLGFWVLGLTICVRVLGGWGLGLGLMGMGLRIRLGVGFVGQCLGGLGFRIRVNCLGLWVGAQGYYFVLAHVWRC